MSLIPYYSSSDKSEIYTGGKTQFKNTAFYSLRIAFKSYFNSYHSMMSKLDYYVDTIEDISLTDSYYESYIETIVHFQHFFELIIKDILEKENPLLAVRAVDKPVLLHKLISKEDISDEEYNSLNSLEFSGALKTLCDLVNSGRIKNPAYQVFSHNKGVLDALNNFRNRIWHRGRFILKYHALDEFICKHVIPLVLDIVEINDYKQFKPLWSYKSENILKINILLDLINEHKKKVPDHSKVALLKEIGRVQYNQNLLFNKKGEEEIKIFSELEEKNNFISEALQCPVCGSMSLLNYHDAEVSIEEMGDEMTPHFSAYQVVEIVESQVHCIICKFEVNRFVKNPSEYGYGDLRFWNID
ncbi:hypothetical protein ACDZ29_25565 [Peribacillus sp. RS7]|uniref:hypothetical protein n=1 Tax=Peribacillus sp. RS7 TaxID=3242679 RepID=UPI0035BF8FE8